MYPTVVMEEQDTCKMEALKNENLELKLKDIRKDVASLKIDLHRHLDIILEKVSLTNGGVAKALDRISILERQDNKAKLEELKAEFKQYKQDTAFWHLIAKNKWVAGMVVFILYIMSIQELRNLVFNFISLK